jgi:hypothetical protein
MGLEALNSSLDKTFLSKRIIFSTSVPIKACLKSRKYGRLYFKYNVPSEKHVILYFLSSRLLCLDCVYACHQSCSDCSLSFTPVSQNEPLHFPAIAFGTVTIYGPKVPGFYYDAKRFYQLEIFNAHGFISKQLT